MNFQFLNRPLGSEVLPFGQIKRYNGGLAASVFGSFISDIINSENVHDTNNSNYLIHQQDRAESKRQFDENLAWLKEQFAKERQYALDERAYQTPQQQVARLRKAGINPALAFGQGNMSTPQVSSVGSAPGGVPSAIPMQSFESHFGENVGAAVNAFYQNQLLNAETNKTDAEGHNIAIDTLTRFAENLAKLREADARIQELLSRKDLNDETREKLQKDREFIDQQIIEAKDSWEERKKAFSLNNKLMESQAENFSSQAVLNRVEAGLKPALANAQIRLSNAQAQQIVTLLPQSLENLKATFYNIKSNTELTRQQKRTEAIKASVAEMEKALREAYEKELKGENGGIDYTGLRQAAKFLGEIMFGELKGLLK